MGGLWEEVGQLQFNFLVAQGLKPEHTLLDIACGSLRGGVHFINYLNPGNYLGLDKEQALINRGIEHELGKAEQSEKQPEFVISDCFEFDHFSKVPDYAIAQSLFTHLVEEDIKACLKNLKAFAGDKPLTFFATFFECETPQMGEMDTSHSHAKFEYTRAQMEQFGIEAGWQAEYIGDWNHPRGQKMVCYVTSTGELNE
ncbi:class I SAM-dependent methyltransferase [Halomonas sp. KX33721]|uniref:class I SAM-dependent methyltransferase n=1 Tax=Halomonas sp. KX33721 TaxID=1819251 RepID=UPI0007865C2C|nr:class I SAM-dependent methyltransferase [Halomonas sp. KX33721]